MSINAHKRVFRTLMGTGLCLALGAGLCACNKAADPEEPVTPDPEPVVVQTDEYLAQIQGAYVPLFDVMGDEANKQIWYDQFAKILNVEDEATAEMLRQIIVSMFTAEAYGEDAVKLAADDPTYYLFYCGYTDDIATITVNGNTITGTDAAGNQVFSHEYTLVGQAKADFGAELNEAYASYFTEDTWPTMAVYEAADATDGFKYFAFCGDTPAETFHIEFRYSAVEEGISSYYEGPCAFFMPSGFPSDADDQMIENVIALFVEENAAAFAEMLTPADLSEEPAAA